MDIIILSNNGLGKVTFSLCERAPTVICCHLVAKENNFQTHLTLKCKSVIDFHHFMMKHTLLRTILCRINKFYLSCKTPLVSAQQGSVPS